MEKPEKILEIIYSPSRFKSKDMKFLLDGASRLLTLLTKLFKENLSTDSVSTDLKKSKPILGSKIIRSMTCWTVWLLLRSSLRTKTTSMQSMRTITGKTTTPNRWRRTHCSCGGRLCRRSSMATTTTTLLRRWVEPLEVWSALTRQASTRGWSQQVRQGARQRRILS